MAAKREYVVKARRGTIYLLFVVLVLYGAWFTLVLFGIDAGWSDDPARWAMLPADVWAFIGLALFILCAVYLFALLVIRERSSFVYRLDDSKYAGIEPSAPAFLRGSAEKEPEQPPT